MSVHAAGLGLWAAGQQRAGDGLRVVGDVEAPLLAAPAGDVVHILDGAVVLDALLHAAHL